MVEVDAPESFPVRGSLWLPHSPLDVGQDIYKFHKILQVTYCIHWIFIGHSIGCGTFCLDEHVHIMFIYTVHT